MINDYNLKMYICVISIKVSVNTTTIIIVTVVVIITTTDDVNSK